jgi:predicted transcriptional regulator of viral defense system
LYLYGIKMQFIDFQNKLSAYHVFSLKDVSKVFPVFNRIQLDRWEKKGYLKKIKRGFYCFSAQELSRDFLFYAANKIYTPSYVSLEMALKYYSFIPEEIFQITSVSTKKATGFETSIGNFSYRHIKPSLYFGYLLVEAGNQKLLLAEPEKAVLDYLYVNPRLKTAKDFEGMRINTDEFKLRINLEKFNKYLVLFDVKQLTARAHTFLTAILAS